MRRYFAISVMAQDRVGIIHAISNTISELDGNIEDLSQTVLHSYFTMMMFASFPDTMTREDVLTSLQNAGKDLNLNPEIGVKALDSLPAISTKKSRDVYVLTATGTDRIGFVATVTGFCAAHGMNIVDLDTRSADGTYIMLLMVDLVGIDPRSAQTQVSVFSEESGLRMTLQHHDVFQATQEVTMPS